MRSGTYFKRQKAAFIDPSAISFEPVIKCRKSQFLALDPLRSFHIASFGPKIISPILGKIRCIRPKVYAGSIFADIRSCFGTTIGSKVELRSLGTSRGTSPRLVFKFFFLKPFLLLPLFLPDGSCLGYPRCSYISAFRRDSTPCL
jgi:hypothetical protein